MSYRDALEAAGATVHDFQSFGSYQGDWWALVTFEGRTGYVHGYYGSCSGCDAFEGEFGYFSQPEDSFEAWATSYRHDDPLGDSPENRRAYAGQVAVYRERLVAFGRRYLDDILTQQEAEADASRNIDWDSQAEEMLTWLVHRRPGSKGAV